MADLGDVVPLSVEIRDTANALANAGNVKLTVTQPDGVVITVDPVAATSTGIYDHDFATTQAGRHVVRWLATGLNAGAYTDTFDVREADPGQIISLADTKAQLNITGTSNDEELRGFIDAATRVIEGIVGSVVRRSWIENYHGGQTSILLRHSPVISITSVTESGATVAASGYTVNPDAGILTRVSGFTPLCWQSGYRNIGVTYVVGRTANLGNVSLAAKIIVQHLWETQRAGGGRPPVALGGEVVGVSEQFGQTFSVPRRAVELLEPDRQFGYA